MTLMDLAVEIQLITKGVIIVAAVLLQRRRT
jgi:ribose/xylose/arabinose/galactoside ABC-type transport system permease subunit